MGDPLRITTRLEGNSILYVREAELKHGRVCMLAFLGIVVGEKYHPFFGGNIDLPAYNVKAMFLETEFKEFWIAGTVIKPKDPKELKEMQSKEINNGRLAMMAVAGILGQELASKAKTF